MLSSLPPAQLSAEEIRGVAWGSLFSGVSDQSLTGWSQEGDEADWPASVIDPKSRGAKHREALMGAARRLAMH